MSPSIFTVPLLMLSLLTSTVRSLTHPSDVAALRSFKAAINPSTIPPWSCLASWNFSHDPCSLSRRTSFLCGLSCSSSRPHEQAAAARVTSITLDSVGYSGTISPRISLLASLIVLDLSDNSFHGPIPPELFSLSSLESLSLRRNSLSGHLPASVEGLVSLRDLDVSGNSLSGSIPETLFRLTNLTRLDLSFNRFNGTIPRLPPNLIELAIRSNSLSGTLWRSSFEGLTQLEVIELRTNSFSGTLTPWLFQLPSLQQINLSNNSFSSIEIWRPVNRYNSALVAVDIGFNKINGQVPVNFSEFPMLWSLSMRYNRLRGPIPGEYGKKGTLKRLYLDGNYLSGKPPAGLVSGEPSVAVGSLGFNCLDECPATSMLCLPSQKPMWVCKQVYGGRKPRCRKCSTGF